MAGPASAKVSAKQKKAITHQLRKAIKKNPKAFSQKWFMKKASLVNFKLPVTIRLRNGTSANNPNQANIDLGASLGQREIELGGSLAAEIVFHDSYDGGALGNVDVNILPSANKSLTSTSVPLLWNKQVSQAGTSWDSNLLASAPGYSTAFPAGCGNVHYNDPSVNSSGNLQFGYGGGPQPGAPSNLGAIGAGGLPGVPIYPDLPTYAANGTPAAFAPAHIGTTATSVGDINAVQASKIAGNNDYVGGNEDPFPYSAQSDPTADGTSGQPTAADTVLRTNALSLNVAPIGEVNQSTNTNGVSGSQNIVIGKSGGQANLFGNIPGKSSGIDVTVNLATKINSILRIVDQDAFEPLIAGGNWPAAVFSCGQVWTGAVQNYIPGVHLSGSLKIAPAITPDGHLRIAKATLSSTGFDPARVALAACLVPYAAYNAQQNNSDTVTPTVPSTPGAADGTVSLGSLPVDPNTERPAPSSATCNSAPTAFVASTALPPSSVGSLAPAAGANGYTVSNSGSTVSVAGDLSVQNVSADILVGDV